MKRKVPPTTPKGQLEQECQALLDEGHSLAWVEAMAEGEIQATQRRVLEQYPHLTYSSSLLVALDWLNETFTI